MLGPARLDTNSLFLTRELRALGVEVTRKQVLPDDQAALAAALSESCRRAEIVICTGGLGPTTDDVTAAAAAEAVGCALYRDPKAVARLREYFKRRKRRLRAVQLCQADRLEPAAWLENRRGSACGQWCPTGRGHVLVLLPGPPEEMRAMFTRAVRPRLARMLPKNASFTRVLSIAGLPEEAVERVAAPLYRKTANPATTILATGDPQVELHFTAWSRTEAGARRLADRLANRIAASLCEAVFSREGETLAAVVGSELRQTGATLAVAESCTGGMLGARITAEAGASDYFLGGVVSYSNGVKQSALGVPEALLARHGAVSAQVAKAMAAGARRALGADWGVAITGVAGPGGGTARKPVGTVYIAIAGPDGAAVAERHLFTGDRDRIRRFSAQAALNALRLALAAARRG